MTHAHFATILCPKITGLWSTYSAVRAHKDKNEYFTDNLSIAGENLLSFQRATVGYGSAPSLDTIREHIKNVVGEPLRECGFTQRRLDHALKFYHDIGYSKDVFLLVNDATALLPALGYRASDDSVHGYAISDDELSQLDVRAGESLDGFLQRFHALKLATQVEIVLLVPLAPRCPPYILAAFAQSGSQTAEIIARRLVIAREEMERRGALIVGWAADGASSNFKLMRQLRQLTPGAPSIEIPRVPTLLSNGNTVRLPGRLASFRGKQFLLPQSPILDPAHLLNLLRNAPLRKNAALTAGDCGISLLRIRDFLAQRFDAMGMEAKLGVRYNDFTVTDRMNFASAQRLFSTTLLTYLEQHCSADYKGTHSIAQSFLV